MSKQAKAASLEVSVSGRRRYIAVPIGRAKELHDYLRSNRVRSAPPEPAYAGFDNIELAIDSDVKSVQALLDKF